MNTTGLTRKLLAISGKAQGTEIALDTDSLPFGAVVENSQKVKKLSLDNSGDLPVRYQWNESTFGPHFHITPTAGKVAPGGEAVFEVSFRPLGLDSDIRQDDIELNVISTSSSSESESVLLLTCTGTCVVQPSESAKILQFHTLVRKEEIKIIKISNPTDKDWFITPSLKSEHWHVLHEIKIPSKTTIDFFIKYLPLTMCLPPLQANTPTSKKSNKAKENKELKDSSKESKENKDKDNKERKFSTNENSQTLSKTQLLEIKNNINNINNNNNNNNNNNVIEQNQKHTAELFLSFPDGTAQSYNLKGYADKPESKGDIIIESPAKKSISNIIQLENWLSISQRFEVTVVLTEKPSNATFVTMSDIVEIGANSTKEFPIRFISYVEGVTKGILTFTNITTGEYLFYSLKAKTLASEILESIKIESPLRQISRYVITVENPLSGTLRYRTV